VENHNIFNPAPTKTASSKAQTWISSHPVPHLYLTFHHMSSSHSESHALRARTRPAKHGSAGPSSPSSFIISPQSERLQNPSMSTSPSPGAHSSVSRITIIYQELQTLQGSSVPPIAYSFVLAASVPLHLCVGTCIQVPIPPSHKHFRAPCLLKNLGT